MNTDHKNWHPLLYPEDWEKLDINNVKFVFDRANKNLDSIHYYIGRTRNQLSCVCLMYITLLAGIVSLSSLSWDFKLWACIPLMIGLVIGACGLLPFCIQTVGNQPNAYFNNDDPKDSIIIDTESALIIGEIILMQKEINVANKELDRHGKISRYSLICILLFFPYVFILGLFLT